jgi:hypothetical protein
MIWIPEAKRSQGLAMIHFLQTGGTTMELSRLTLVVVTGLLQSMVDAMPQRIGQTFLRQLYDHLHQLEEEPIQCLRGVAMYYSRVTLTTDKWLDLDWWEAALRMDISLPAYSGQQGTLGISYGDGSGSGTGGTIQVGDHHGKCPTMEAWMGTWMARVHSFSSNWKEL